LSAIGPAIRGPVSFGEAIECSLLKTWAATAPHAAVWLIHLQSMALRVRSKPAVIPPLKKTSH
jgi:hypothetical protein